jgi:hypothetical protein
LPAKGAQKIDHLGYELAYETWHKMLFAKFLEANGLLMHTDGVAVTMEDCEELAKEEGFTDKWDAAANYASKMLPAIFRPEDPLMQVTYATDERIKLEELIDGLETPIFIADDALGWVYQFWQSEAKAAINASGDKIDGARLPAVTQLFTEPYMVHFLIDNTLGAWWVSRNPGIKPPLKFEYLRLLDDGTPVAGKFEGWPDRTAEVTSLDPCMGSGHFVTALFTVFAALRMHEEGLSKEEATDKVITENLHGLEIDARCTQIAAFNLALTAWKFCGHYKELPEMNLACSGIAPKGKVEDWVKLVGKATRADDKARMENGMRELYNHFQLAPELGSLLDPTTIKADAFTASFEDLKPVLQKALQNEHDAELLERGVMAAGIAKAGLILAKKFMLIITNVPYLARGKQDVLMNGFCDLNYPDSKGDLAVVFLERLFKLNNRSGKLITVIPQNWLYISSYKKFREKLLKNESLNLIARLGSGAFSQISGEVVKAILLVATHCKPDLENSIKGIDVSKMESTSSKDIALKGEIIGKIHQSKQLLNPDCIISIDDIQELNLLNQYATCIEGISTGDNGIFVRNFWEIINNSNDWVYFIQNVTTPELFGGRTDILLWQGGKGLLHSSPSAHNFPSKIMNGFNVLGQWGIRITQMTDPKCTLYTGEIFGKSAGTLVVKEKKYLPAVWEFCNSEQFIIDVNKINQSLYRPVGTFVKVPFDLEYWQQVAAEKYPNGLPKPYSDDPTQWLFHGHPIKTDNPLHVAIARVLGYRWPAETDTEMELADEARALIAAVKAFDHLTDEDGIFCIPSVNSEHAGADRLRDYLQQVFAGEWSNQTINQLLQKEGAKATNLESWLRDEFFVQHCKVFQNRPFIWHIWDGRKDGFSALVNYHKLDKDNLSKLIYAYLGDWIRMCEAKVKAGESGADGLLIAAKNLKDKLEAILHGEAPYDIFVRWKTLAQQPIGWEPDLNDGVRLNIRPFVEAGVLRSKFNIKWGIDRGKNPPGSPWGEVRDNDKHLGLEEKRGSKG